MLVERLAGESLRRRQIGGPYGPIAMRIGAPQADVRLGKKRVVNPTVRKFFAGVWAPLVILNLGVAIAHHPERVLVATEPDMQSMLEDAAVARAHRRALAP